MGFFSKLFSFTQELAIDLGTANTIIIADDEIAVNEPSVVALDTHTEKMIAVGDNAKLMYEKTNNTIRVLVKLGASGLPAHGDDFGYGEQGVLGLTPYGVTLLEGDTGQSADIDGERALSENGAVTRGVCVADENEMLTQVIETTGIAKKDGKLVCDRPDVQQWLQPENWVSMNMWACYPDFLECLGKGFEEFLASAEGDPCKKEYLVPVIIDGLLKSGKATVKVLETPDRWIGITYQEDTEAAQKGFADMIAAGEYPEKLWG